MLLGPTERHLQKATSPKSANITDLPNTQKKNHSKICKMRRQRNMFQIKEQDKGLRKRTKQREDKQKILSKILVNQTQQYIKMVLYHDQLELIPDM